MVHDNNYISDLQIFRGDYHFTLCRGARLFTSHKIIGEKTWFLLVRYSSLGVKDCESLSEFSICSFHNIITCTRLVKKFILT